MEGLAGIRLGGRCKRRKDRSWCRVVKPVGQSTVCCRIVVYPQIQAQTEGTAEQRLGAREGASTPAYGHPRAQAPHRLA